MTSHPPDPRTPQEILEQMYALRAQTPAAERSAADLLFLYADNSYYAGQFEHINELMELADLSKLGTTLGLSILTVAHWARPNLPGRVAYLERYRAYLALTEAPERIHGLTKGLE